MPWIPLSFWTSAVIGRERSPNWRNGFASTSKKERKKLAATIFGLIRQQATQAEIEAITLREGERLGLSRAEVIQVATWVANTAALREAA